MAQLALTLPGGQTISAPSQVPTGGLNTVAKVIGNALTILLIVAVILTLIYLILGGMTWIRSGGDKQKIAQARSRITYAIIGLIIMALSLIIVNVFTNALGVKDIIGN